MIGSLANYSNTIPNAPAEGDAKPAQPSAQMGKLFCYLWQSFMCRRERFLILIVNWALLDWIFTPQKSLFMVYGVYGLRLISWFFPISISTELWKDSILNEISHSFLLSLLRTRISKHTLSQFTYNRHIYWRVLAMYAEYFRCDIVHSFNMGRWNCWRHLRLLHSLYMLLCGEYILHAFLAVC